ncbi:hypothetical protein HJFPF1_05152 [Paramyrothecium foliicola]|nr:hypothetical protein HJFPF1_05152 [Paramyrothecium foliicola]
MNIILTGSLTQTSSPLPAPASFRTALEYIELCSALHRASLQNRTALSTALFLSLAKLDNRKEYPKLPLFEEHHQRQFDRILTLSAKDCGMKPVLGSIFYESGLTAKACGAWLQGTMAVLQSKGSDNLHILARAHKDFLRSTSGLLGSNRIDVYEAAWTGTLCPSSRNRCLRYMTTRVQSQELDFGTGNDYLAYLSLEPVDGGTYQTQYLTAL